MKKDQFFKSMFGGLVFKHSCIYFLAVMFLAIPVTGFSMMYENPKSFSLQDKSKVHFELKTLPKIDIKQLLAEDQTQGRDPEHPTPYRYAVAADVNYNLENSGSWKTLSDGRLWRLRIQSPGVKNLSLGITRFDMPEGAKLWIYDPGQEHVEGPYLARDRSPSGSLWTPIIEGEDIVVEVFLPAGVSQPVIEIGKVNQGYRGFTKAGLFGNSEGACEIDVACPVGAQWQDQIRAVGVYSISDGSQLFGCTGTLLNDTARDYKPYFLSAHHCFDPSRNRDPNSIVVYWNFQSPPPQPPASGCPIPAHMNGSLNQSTVGGAWFRAHNAASDFALVELKNTPDPNFNVFHAGWDASGTTPTATLGIHHPRTDVKAISFSNTAPTPTTNLWRVVWNSGVTETGSSGSCLFDTSNKRCIGQLYSGNSDCSNPAGNDYYGRLSASWNGGGTPDTRLKDWLDPGSTGTLGLDGDPHITTANGIHYDFQGAGEYVALRDPNGLEIQVRQAPIATTFNPGADPHDGLATCVSLNTAVAAKVGDHRVTYQFQPGLSSENTPAGLQLRVDGVPVTLTQSGLDLGRGGRITKASTQGDLQIQFPDSSLLSIVPGWWNDTWYLNVDLARPHSVDGIEGAGSGVVNPQAAGGLMASIRPDSWLPALPDGSSMGPMPGTLHDRYVALYNKFGEAWRVTEASSLFDYEQGKPTDTFTMRNWPLENPPCEVPGKKPVQPATHHDALEACRIITAENLHANCVFDVEVTGNLGFAQTYLHTQQLHSGATKTTVKDSKDPSKYGENVAFTATAVRTDVNGEASPTGAIQFSLDNVKVGSPVTVNSSGIAVWSSSSLQVGNHQVSVNFIPSPGSQFLDSASPNESHTVLEAQGRYFWLIIMLLIILILIVRGILR